jgi:hypothetical protein
MHENKANNVPCSKQAQHKEGHKTWKMDPIQILNAKGPS